MGPKSGQTRGGVKVACQIDGDLFLAIYSKGFQTLELGGLQRRGAVMTTLATTPPTPSSKPPSGPFLRLQGSSSWRNQMRGNPFHSTHSNSGRSIGSRGRKSWGLAASYWPRRLPLPRGGTLGREKSPGPHPPPRRGSSCRWRLPEEEAWSQVDENHPHPPKTSLTWERGSQSKH